jgi:putative addiction module CopG family antidote
MSITLTPEQEQFVQTKLLTGKYYTVEEVLAAALQLLDEYDQYDLDNLTRAADAERLQAYRKTGNGIPHAQVAAWLSTIGTDDELPCPN